jgi:YbbR domain-containing protein
MSDSRSLWGLRMLALALALFAWFLFSGEKREPQSEKVVEASVRYDAPTGFLLLERIETVRVTARGPLSKIRILTAPFVDVFVDLPQEEGRQQLAIGEDQVILPEGLELVSVEPNVIEVTLDRHATRFVPVRPNLRGEPSAGARVVSARVIPRSVLVAGPDSRLRALQQVTTLPIDLAGHARDFEQEVAVRPPEPLISIQDQPTVNVIVQLEIPNLGPADDVQPPVRN